MEKETEVKPPMSQKEYLRKYLMKDKKDKVKKKKHKISSSTILKRSVIIDDNEISVGFDDRDDIAGLIGEEAPQIVGKIIDDRPREVQMKEKFSSDNWEMIDGVRTEKKFRDRGESDAESVRSWRNGSNSVPRRDRQSSDSDLSPPRKSDKTSRRPRKESDSDQSPPRKSDRTHRQSKKGSDSDLSPPRKSNNSNRHSRKGPSPHRKSEKRHRSRNGSDSDLSPPRKSNVKSHRSRNESDSDLSPPRKSDRNRRPKKGSDSDLSPPRKSDKTRRRPKNGSTTDLSPSRQTERTIKKSRKDSVPPPTTNKETLDGKRAGLQKAKNLKDELKQLKDKEDQMFRALDPSTLGRSAAPIVRDRKTGLRRDFEKEKEEQREKAARAAVIKEKYDRWGRGLKQVRDYEDNVADMVHEMSKPLARYADDDDLDKLLRAQERQGDPMLEYIRSKQREAHTVDLTIEDGSRKQYLGAFTPNRFNIRPGHRWDGVDRSNGYEIRWFESRSSQTAVEEEAWKWSSADM